MLAFPHATSFSNEKPSELGAFCLIGRLAHPPWVGKTVPMSIRNPLTFEIASQITPLTLSGMKEGSRGRHVPRIDFHRRNELRVCSETRSTGVGARLRQKRRSNENVGVSGTENGTGGSVWNLRILRRSSHCEIVSDKRIFRQLSTY